MEATISNFLSQTESTEAVKCPTWTSVMQRTSLFAITLPDIATLFQNNLLLCVHLFMILRVKGMIESAEKMLFVQSIQMYVDKFKTTEKTEAKLFLIYGLCIQLGLNEPLNSWGSFLLQIARHFLTISGKVGEGWGDGILGAIGLKKEPISIKMRALTRCLACFIFASFDESYVEHKFVQDEFKVSFDELKQMATSKKFGEVRTQVLEIIGMLNGKEAIEGDVKPNVAKVIRMFYKDHFLESVEDVWK